MRYTRFFLCSQIRCSLLRCSLLRSPYSLFPKTKVPHRVLLKSD
ncbi:MULTISPECIES: hypothetical protein [unclassified Moorena]|nr:MULTISPECIES: hypothetical protein [unclassified Moorena]